MRKLKIIKILKTQTTLIKSLKKDFGLPKVDIHLTFSLLTFTEN